VIVFHGGYYINEWGKAKTAPGKGQFLDKKCRINHQIAII
jgi:hypothetical protein